MKFNRNQRGFTLIELLIVVAIIGILAAIAIPNLLTAMQRSKQKRTMADMRTVATSWEAYATDYNNYKVSAAISQEVTSANLVAKLQPTYIRVLPTKDAWNNAYAFGTDTNFQEYRIVSGGKDGGATYNTTTVGATTDFDCDIVYETGTFIAYPEGAQQAN